jgi:hypothetical protein
MTVSAELPALSKSTKCELAVTLKNAYTSD